MKKYKIRKLHEDKGIHIQDMTWTQVLSNPTALSVLLVTMDNLKNGEMLEITLIEANDN